MDQDIWILLQHRNGELEEYSVNLVSEAQRLKTNGNITGICFGHDLDESFAAVKNTGMDNVLYLRDPSFQQYHGELVSMNLAHLIHQRQPSMILATHSIEMEDLLPRVAAATESTLVTRVMDFETGPGAQPAVLRPIANGYLFEKVLLSGPTPHIVSYLPDVLGDTVLLSETPPKIEFIEPIIPAEKLSTSLVEIIESDPGDLDLEEADIIVAGGRGVGKGDAFDMIHQLAEALGGSVGGTRPVVDWNTLEFDRQIGQTGKTVTPRLIINCGISGANEYTAGIEKSNHVIAIDVNPKARIFRFADLGIIGDVREILPLLTEAVLRENNRLREGGRAETE